MHDRLIDRIYEAAFNPEQWTPVLEELSVLSGSAGGEILLFDDVKAVNFRATQITHDVAAFVCHGGWRKTSRRIQHFHAQPCSGFVTANEYFPDDVRIDEGYQMFRAMGLDSQAGTIIPMPGGELVVFAFERWHRLGLHEPEAIAQLNLLHPHLARASFIATRLGLEHAQAAVATLASLGLPAAVLSYSGKVRAANALLDTVADRLIPTAYGGLAVNHAATNALFQDAIAQARGTHDGIVRSIAVPAQNEERPLILHLLPLRRSAHDIFAGADILLSATSVHASTFVPAPQILMGLFDLTPAEVKLAAALAEGRSLRDAAAASGIQFSTARSYLERIFRKTGTKQQSQLVALLKGAPPLPGRPPL
ncbi:MAG: hypothetical protein BGP04_18165 [Rhizobiales bacterium 62-17]|nr:MAG: hypothetical protein BGP04_18165 [Rhizobiales bacterium 62-17]